MAIGQVGRNRLRSGLVWLSAEFSVVMTVFLLRVDGFVQVLRQNKGSFFLSIFTDVKYRSINGDGDCEALAEGGG